MSKYYKEKDELKRIFEDITKISQKLPFNKFYGALRVISGFHHIYEFEKMSEASLAGLISESSLLDTLVIRARGLHEMLATCCISDTDIFNIEPLEKDIQFNLDDSSSLEQYTQKLYSSLWVEYSDEQYMDSMNLFEDRFRINGISLEFIKDKRCLDMGCGGGRYTLQMARLGAKEAVGIDLGKRGLSDARERQRKMCIDNATFIEHSVLSLPFNNEEFDFVISNGVLHHTINTQKGINELYRVLKKGSDGFIFLYGDGGIRWYYLDLLKGMYKDIQIDFSIKVLKEAGVPANKRMCYLDFAYVPINNRYTLNEVMKMLSQSGFDISKCQHLPRSYQNDFNELVYNDVPGARLLYGEDSIDIRIWLKK